ncbi:MAG TPA: metal ABC transporter permease [Thermoplasmata archaeon]|nr:metal ABC transporter permease [Thermoplasmata archaeon]
MSWVDQVVSLLGYGFVQRAFLIGILVALLSSLLSVFIVLKNVSLIGDGLAHTAFGGLAIGYYVGFFPLWTAGVLVVLGSMGITKLTRSTKITSDAAVAVFLTLGLASGILFYELGRGFGINLESLLFGSILLASTDQFLFVAAILAAVLALMLFSFSKLVYTTFNETQAQAAGIRTAFFDYLLSALAGVAVIVSIPIAGILLIAALLVLPGLTSIQMARSFRETMILSPVIGLATVIVGMLLSLAWDVAPGATIVLTGLGILLIVMVSRKLVDLLVRKPVSSHSM